MSSNWIRVGLAALVVTAFATALVVAQGAPKEPGRSRAIPTFNPVEGRMVVVTSTSDGARVEKGDVVCELDSVELRDRLANQDIVVRAAAAELQSRRIAREVAVMTVAEQKDGGLRQQLAGNHAELKLAEVKLVRAEDQVDWSRRMFNKGYVSLAEKTANELLLQQARFELEEAQANRSVLVGQSKEKAMKVLLGAVESAQARELGAEAALERERSLQKRLADQVARCKVAAPAAGRVEFALPIASGAVIRDGELLFRIVPDGAPRAKAD